MIDPGRIAARREIGVGLALIAVLAVAAVLAPLLTSHDPMS